MIILRSKLSLEESFADQLNRELFAFRGKKLLRLTHTCMYGILYLYFKQKEILISRGKTFAKRAKKRETAKLSKYLKTTSRIV